MSSILRALKKLEKEPRHLEEPHSLDSRFVTLADTGPQRSIYNIIMMVVCTGIVCGLVILAGLWFFAETEHPPPAVNQDTAQTVSRPDEITPAPSGDLTDKTEPGVSKRPVTLSAPAAAIKEPADSSAVITPKDKKPLIATSGSAEPSAKPGVAGIRKLNNPGMKLQAITWSRTPHNRIAVINNRIVREGEMVTGYLINTINQDDVVLSQDGTKWKLLFR